MMNLLLRENLTNWFDFDRFLHRIQDDVKNDWVHQFENFDAFLGQFQHASALLFSINGQPEICDDFCGEILHGMKSLLPEIQFVPFVQENTKNGQSLKDWHLSALIFRVDEDADGAPGASTFRQFWSETLDYCGQIQSYLQKEKIHFFVLNETHTQAHIPSLRVAVSLVTTILNIPVLHVSESGPDLNSGLKAFFENSDETNTSTLADIRILPLIELFYPWPSSNWYYIYSTADRIPGINPANSFHVKEKTGREELYLLFEKIFWHIHLRQKNELSSFTRVEEFISKQYKINLSTSKEVSNLFPDKNKAYIPGISKLKFMTRMRSIQDSFYYLTEIADIRNEVLSFAEDLGNALLKSSDYIDDRLPEFYFETERLFHFKKGKTTTIYKHAFIHKHSSLDYFPYQELTLEELKALLVSLFYSMFPDAARIISESGFYKEENEFQFNFFENKEGLTIDHRKKYYERLKSRSSIGLFLGLDVETGLDVFCRQAVRKCLGLNNEQELEPDYFTQKNKETCKVYVFVAAVPVPGKPTLNQVLEGIKKEKELSLLHQYGFLDIVQYDWTGPGIHFKALGEKASLAINQIKKENGFLVMPGPEYFTGSGDFLLDRFYYGRVQSQFQAAYSGLEQGAQFFVYLPSGEAVVQSYPAPLMNLSRFIVSNDVKDDNRPEEISLSAGEKGLVQQSIYGLHPDGEPWTGTRVQLGLAQDQKRNYQIETSKTGFKTVSEFIQWFERRSRKKALIAMNCACILNKNIISKLGLPERFEGSPTGLLIKNGELQGLPLYNKTAFLVYHDGSFEIKRVNTIQGMTVSCRSRTVEFPPSARNIDPVKQPLPDFCFYDLMYEKNEIPGDGRVVMRFSGHTIKELIFTRPGENVPVKPVGICLSIADEAFPPTWDMIDKDLDFVVHGLEDVLYAFEAGPTLLEQGEVSLKLIEEGFLLTNFQKVSPDGVSMENFRSPRMAIAIDKDDDLYVYYINGMVSESVGASYAELANILKSEGMIQAMCMEPSEISSLLVQGRVISNSVYHPDYKKHPYALSPQLHKVRGAFIVY